MIRKELSFSIHNKFSADSPHNEDLFKHKHDLSATVGETAEDDFSFGNNGTGVSQEGSGEENDAVEGFGSADYVEMDGGDPSNPSFLKKYAQFLELKGEFSKAEEYYFRATLADPKDGEILCRYAKLVWELHRDRERALSYFEKAALSAPGDSDILAAHANFLWKIDEEEEEGDLSDMEDEGRSGILRKDAANSFSEVERPNSPPLHLAMGLGIDISRPDRVDFMETEAVEQTTSVEEYYGRMLEENSCNPLFLKDYAMFLHQVKGDLEGAEEYYLQAIQDDSCNGQIMSQYANLVWQLHRDTERADACFKLAIEASSEDSDILASYAKFLWEIEDEVEDFSEEAYDQVQDARNLPRAEEYYARAMLNDPGNGKIISEYANFLWHLRADKERAEVYFKLAIEADPEDCHVLGSYAKFMWEMEDEEEE